MSLSASAARCSGGGRDGSRVSHLGCGGWRLEGFRVRLSGGVSRRRCRRRRRRLRSGGGGSSSSGRTPGRFFFVSFLSLRGGWLSFGCGLFFRMSLHRRRSASSALKYRHFRRFLAHPVKRGMGRSATLLLTPRAGGIPLPIGGPRSTLSRGPCRVLSLTGAVRLSNGNAGIPRRAQRGRKPHVEQKGKSSLDLDFQYEYGPRKRGPSILSERRAPFRREVSEKLPQG